MKKYVKLSKMYLTLHLRRSDIGAKGQPRSLEGLQQAFTAFVNSGGNRQQAKHFGNVIHMPILSGEPHTLVIDLLPPPELHLLLGGVNTLFKGSCNATIHVGNYRSCFIVKS